MNPDVTSVPVLAARGLGLHYGATQALEGIDLEIPGRSITAIIGPSGCGKSTLLRTFNRMNDFIPGVRLQGEALYHGHDLYHRDVDPVEVRRRVGMVFQKPNPFPKSIAENVLWGPRIHGLRGDGQALLEEALGEAALWNEVKYRLDEPATVLSGGQQQRLCIARALAMKPEILLMDEPCSALDPLSTARIEELLVDLKRSFTIVIVTHNMQQAGRISDHTAFLEAGRLVEFGPTAEVFSRPRHSRTADYVNGRFG